jgi:hypothetical protein
VLERIKVFVARVRDAEHGFGVVEPQQKPR